MEKIFEAAFLAAMITPSCGAAWPIDMVPIITAQKVENTSPAVISLSTYSFVPNLEIIAISKKFSRVLLR